MRFSVVVVIAASVWLTGCYTHEVNTFPKWCEQIESVNLEQKYRPFWAVIFAVSFKPDAIRDDFVKFLNDSHMEKVGRDRIARMAWREGNDLHLVNLSSLMEIESEKVIAEWRKGIEADKAYTLKDRADRCLYGTITSLFDNMKIHSMQSDVFGRNWTDDVTVIDMDRKQRLKTPL